MKHQGCNWHDQTGFGLSGIFHFNTQSKHPGDPSVPGRPGWLAHGEPDASHAHSHRAHSLVEEATNYKPRDEHFSRGSTGWCESPEEAPHPAEGVQEGFPEEVASKLKPSRGTGSGRSKGWVGGWGKGDGVPDR